MEKAAAIRALGLFLVEDTDRKKAIVRQIEELGVELDVVRANIRANHQFQQRLRDADSRIVTAPQAGTVRAQVTDTAEAIIRSEGPQHRRVLLGLIEGRGVVVGGRDPLSNMSAYLSRDPRFAASGDGIWSLVEADVGPVQAVAVKGAGA